MPRTRLSRFDVFSVAVALAILAGCGHVNDPWRDSSAVIDHQMTTPSAEGFKGQPEFGRTARRDVPPATVYYENGSVTHWPLWWEDPFEDQGNNPNPSHRDAVDPVFAMNWVDYLHIGYGPARLVLNTVGWPVSAVVTPPGTLLESDGRIDRGLLWHDHDAKRADSVTREPPDVNVIGKRHLVDAPSNADASPPPANAEPTS